MHSRLSDIAGPLDADSRERLAQLKSMHLAEGSVLFRPGDEAKGFVLVRSGRIAVYLTGPNGREILLYAVEPGETCIQTTLGILGGQHYTGEAIAETAVEMTVIPRAMFLSLGIALAIYLPLLFLIVTLGVAPGGSIQQESAAAPATTTATAAQRT